VRKALSGSLEGDGNDRHHRGARSNLKRATVVAIVSSKAGPRGSEGVGKDDLQLARRCSQWPGCAMVAL
jgi:hypothetical protein